MCSIEIFHQRLREVFEKNIKNSDFFEAVGIKKANFKRLLDESGNPGVKTVMHIAQVANVSPGWLMGEPETDSLYKRIAELEKELSTLKDELDSVNRQNTYLQELISSKQELVDAYKKMVDDKDSQISTLNRTVSEVLKFSSDTAKNEIVQKGAARFEHKSSL